MFDEDLPKAKTEEFPRNITDMSIGELEEYIQDLKAEIVRAEQDIAKKKASNEAANSIFK